MGSRPSFYEPVSDVVVREASSALFGNHWWELLWECERDISKRLSSYPLEKKNKTRFSWTLVMFWNMYNKCCGPAWWWCLGHETLNSLSSSVHCCPARTERRLKGRRRRRKKKSLYGWVGGVVALFIDIFRFSLRLLLLFIQQELPDDGQRHQQ